MYLLQGLSLAPRVHSPRDARVSLTSPLNWIKGEKGAQSPETISLLKHLKGNRRVPPGPLGVRQGRRAHAARSLSGHPVRAASPSSPSGQQTARPLALAQILAALLLFWTSGGNSCLQLWGSPAETRTLEASVGL